MPLSICVDLLINQVQLKSAVMKCGLKVWCVRWNRPLRIQCLQIRTNLLDSGLCLRAWPWVPGSADARQAKSSTLPEEEVNALDLCAHSLPVPHTNPLSSV